MRVSAEEGLEDEGLGPGSTSSVANRARGVPKVRKWGPRRT